MELNQYLKILRKFFLFIFIFSLLGLVFGLVLSRNLPSGYSQNQLVLLTDTSPSADNNQNHDYYSQEKSRNFTDTAISIIESADFSQAIIAKGQSLSVRKVAPQVIRLTAFAQNPEETNPLIEKTVGAFNQKIQNLSQGSPQLKIIGSIQPSSHKVPSKSLFAFVGLLSGLLFSLLAISLKTYLKI